ncbi:MAG: energy transducer TonB [Verrucomicrobiota bacterium]
MTAPVYPPAAQRDNIEGTTHLSIKVAADGTVASATVSKSSGSRLLDQEALQAVKTWQFQPASTGGKAIPSVVNAPVIFRLQ